MKGIRGKLEKQCRDIDDGTIETMGAYIVKMQDVSFFGCAVELVDRKKVQNRKLV